MSIPNDSVPPVEAAGPAGLVNVRDLGGLPVAGGATTVPGVLFRSDAPYDGDIDPTDLLGWPPSTIVDLRGTEESDLHPRRWSGATRVVHHQLYERAQVGVAPLDGSLTDLYRSILREAPERIAAALGRFDAAGTTLVHCAAGKDRTGIVIALTLRLAGVDRGSIVADYQRTAESIDRVVARLQARGLVPEDLDADLPILGSPPDAITAVLDEFDAGAGAWDWFERNGGEVDALRTWLTHFVGDPRESRAR